MDSEDLQSFVKLEQLGFPVPSSDVRSGAQQLRNVELQRHWDTEILQEAKKCACRRRRDGWQDGRQCYNCASMI